MLVTCDPSRVVFVISGQCFLSRKRSSEEVVTWEVVAPRYAAPVGPKEEPPSISSPMPDAQDCQMRKTWCLRWGRCHQLKRWLGKSLFHQGIVRLSRPGAEERRSSPGQERQRALGLYLAHLSQRSEALQAQTWLCSSRTG